MLFWFGFVCGVLALIVVAVVLDLRSKKAKRLAFEREVAAIDAKYPMPTSQTKGEAVDPDIEALRNLRSRVLATDGPMTDAQTIEMDGILKRLEAKGVDIGPLLKEPIRPLATAPTQKGVH